MKISTPEIYRNLHFEDGTPVIPSGFFVTLIAGVIRVQGA